MNMTVVRLSYFYQSHCHSSLEEYWRDISGFDDVYPTMVAKKEQCLIHIHIVRMFEIHTHIHTMCDVPSVFIFILYKSVFREDY